MLRTSFLSALLTLAVATGTVSAQQSRCADCHFANVNAPGVSHLADWERSVHGRNSVGCEKCHGGDSTTFELLQAHRGMLNSRNPASPTNGRNLPQTCGACHIGPFVEFQKSKHFELLLEKSEDTPTCSTCHTEVGANLPSPKGLASQCSKCHGADKTAPRADYPAQGKMLLERILEVRTLLNEAKPLIRRVTNEAQRKRLQEQYNQAEVPLKEAIQAGHSFVFDKLEERHQVARARAEALLQQIANPR